MRFMTVSVLVGCMSLAATANARAQWTEAKIPGEQTRTVQGCAQETQKPGDWVCILVRCDRPRAPVSLHFSTPGSDIHGKIKLVIDEENSFTLSVPKTLQSPLAHSTRAEALSEELLEAMKAGRMVAIQGTDLKPPYNRIPLENSRTAIERVEQACVRSLPNAASFFRRIGRNVGLY
jgi:hypothetical protein